MKFLLLKRTLFLFFLLCSFVFAAGPKKGETLDGKVVGVTDGDTLTLLVNKEQIKIRLNGIDAPESGQAFGTKAKQSLSEKVFGKEVKLTSQGQDKYGRTLGIIKIEDRDINAEMIKEGWAWHYKQFNKSEDLAKAEKDAREKKLGLWADEKPTPPWEWRHNKESRTEENTRRVEADKKYWVSNTGKRHNSSCRYYEKTKGHWGEATEGTACKVCGG